MPHSRILLGLACLGVSVCAACGSRFTSADASGENAGAAASADGGGMAAAGTDSGGDAGETSTAGSGGTASAGSGGTTSAGSGGTTSAGAGGSSAGAGGSSAGSGGKGGRGGATGTAGSSGTAGTAGATVCDTLQADYLPLLEKARVCDKGSLGQCSASSTLSPLGACPCPVLVNAKSPATVMAQKKYQELQDNMCFKNGGVLCKALCLPPMGAACEQQMTSTGTATFMCTPTLAIAN
ncbi:MAG: hypothetical protein ABI488_18430 [Polyangiaceae bacterium]